MAKEDSKDKKNSIGRCEGPYCVQPSWESHSIINVEGFEKFVPKQQRPEEVGAESQAQKNKNGVGRQYSKISHDIFPL